MRAAAVGEADDCAAGGHCYRDICHQICADGAGGCGDGQCTNFVNLDFGICLPSCDPVMQNCPEGTGCYGVAGGHACVGAGDSVVGDECEFANSCVPYLGCIGSAENGYFCRRVCPLAGCFDDTTGPTMCGCGTSTMGAGTEAQCGVAEMCLPIMGSVDSGYCFIAADNGCDCTDADMDGFICPQEMMREPARGLSATVGMPLNQSIRF